tara:strand:- start:74 stop:478 length:405 start_codon:yes stop_codon:yes gene_type:complete
MKKSQLRKIIKEEISKIYDDPIRTKAEERYKDHSSVNISGIGDFMDRIKIIPKGDYTVTDGGDMEGRYSSPQFNITLLAPIKPFDLAVQLAEKTGWISPWNYLEMKMGHAGGRDIKDPKALTFPREKTLFDDPD